MKTVSFNPVVETREVRLPTWEAAETLDGFPSFILPRAHSENSSRQDGSDSDDDSPDDAAARGFTPGSRHDKRSVVVRMDPELALSWVKEASLSPMSSRIWQRRMNKISAANGTATSCAMA